MKITHTLEPSEYDEYRQFLTIYIDDKEVFSVHDGEPEDNNLYRNFNDCLKLPELLEMVYKRGLEDGRVT